MPVLAGGRVRRPAAGPSSRHAALLLNTSRLLTLGQLLPPPSLVVNLPLRFCPFCFPLPQQGQHLSYKSFAKRTNDPSPPHAHTHSARGRGWGRGTRGAIGNLGIGPGYDSPVLKGLQLLRDAEEVRASPGFIRERVTPLPIPHSHPSPNPCTAR